ncbi:pyridoxal phosphate-dependent aminotransferase [Maritalea mediterranea]|uniref:aspartate transaminase n=1 Tax=Maritalea mediterranea TaxID=2909667 RepID=A0ABS9EAG8_9HYPH|nr:aminotransferase class I/II-fold pyridoxal phosphate-dependent enzyme [Maritalea mediterranea]MCF4099842.1 aminotransferase class I/II-fold pyridoxal phosphate-dependent enzyme [Maritalea mediterranea]
MTKMAQLPHLQPFFAMELLAMAKSLEAEGRDICHLEVGEPGATPAPEVIAAVQQSAQTDPQRYTPAKGELNLRTALASYYQDRHKVTVNPDNILVTNGSSAGFVLAFLTGFEKGSKIAVTRPGYPAYLNIISSLGFEPVEIEVFAENGWRLDADDIRAAFKSQPFDGLLLASPANPTGAMVERDELADILKACDDLGIRFISDEIYHGLSHGLPETSALELNDKALIINSFSKYYCMTGWRLGWLVLPDELVRQTEMLAQNMFISAPSLSQVAGQVALGCRNYYDAQKADYVRNGMVLTEALKEMGFKDARMSDGAFYAYVGIDGLAEDSVAFCKSMLQEAGVAATPGVDFDRVKGHKFVRFSYAGDHEMLVQAIEKMAGFLSRPLAI